MRFEREARVLAALNHANIGALYGVVEADGIRGLVLELVEGLTLAAHLSTPRKGRSEARGLPINKAIDIARQIAEALAAAHERGIIHRDLKPANIKITAGGAVKVLDFGLAKAHRENPTDLSRPPSSSVPSDGVLLGTAAYVSPEQARGEVVDKRSDIWAFGCVLFEMLTGQQAFPGDTVSDHITAILERDPNWAALPVATPTALQRLMRRCLEKEPRRRLHDIADARIELEELLSVGPERLPSRDESADASMTTSSGRRYAALIVGIVAIVTGAAVSAAIWRRFDSGSGPVRITRSIISTPTPLSLFGNATSIALSPDGTRLVYTTGDGLHLRALDELDSKFIAGTESGTGPFFSPDGQWIAFFAKGTLKKVALAGSVPQTICDCDVGDPRGAAWGADGTIVFPRDPRGGLSRVAATGGTPEALTTLDGEKHEKSHRFPHFLADGKSVLFTIVSSEMSSWNEARIGVVSLQTRERRIVIEGGTNPRFSPSGHLVYVRDRSLVAVPFDPSRLEITGRSVPIVDGITVGSVVGSAEFTFSNTGSLAYVSRDAGMDEARVVWVDRNGAVEPLIDERRRFGHTGLNLSPDGQKLSLWIGGGPNDRLWVYDLMRDNLTPLSFAWDNRDLGWTPDGKRITFISDQLGPYNLFWQNSDGSGSPELLARSDEPLGFGFTGSWSPDGKTLVVDDWHPTTNIDIALLTLEHRQLRPLIRTRFDEELPALSRDGKWLAYVSNESGRQEVYVQSFPDLAAKWQISSGGGSWPRWHPRGRELYYRHGGKLMAVPNQTEPTFVAGTPRLLFEGPYTAYDVAVDGRFVMVQFKEAAPVTEITLVLNWFEEIKRRMQTP